MRILVTGAAGFLGSHIARTLVSEGHTVVAFDNRRPIDDIEWHEGDLRDGSAVANAVAGQDVVCHVGAIGDVYLAAEDPVLASEVNVTGSTHIANAAVRHGTRVVYASTWEVYGRPVYEPMDEDHPCEPDHPYNITKLAGERMLLSAGKLHDFPVLALRLGTAYGPGLRRNSVFRIFIERARNQEPITIQGDGSQGRQFTHTTDISNAFSLACRTDLRGTALNIVAEEVTSIKNLAQAIAGRYPTEIRFGPGRPGDVTPAVVSAERASRLLSWRAETRFSKGIDDLMTAV